MALRTLYQACLDSDPARLRVIAYLWDLELHASRRPDMAAEIVAAMASAEAVTSYLERMSPDERTAIEDLVREGGALPWTIFERRWGTVRTAGPGRVEREELWRAPASAAEALWYAGWVHRTFEQRGERAVEMAFVPEDLVLYIGAPPLKDIPPPPATSPPEICQCADDSLADDVVTLWSAVQRSDDLREGLLTQLHPPADQRLALAESLSVEGEWLRKVEEGRLQPVPKAIVAWLRSDSWSQWSSLIHAWSSSERWDDLARIGTLTPDRVKGWQHDPQTARQAFLAAFGRCEPGQWYEISAFVDYIKTYDTDFLRPDGDYDSWAPRDSSTDTPLRGFEAWDAVEGALIPYLITGPLHWLGLVDLGSRVPTPASQGKENAGGNLPPDVFRPTTAAAAVLHQAEVPILTPPPPVELTASAELIAPPRRRYERLQLSRVADPVGTAGDYRYRLSPSSLRRAKQQRIAHERIIAFLKQATQMDDLPPHIAAAIRRVYEDNTGASLAQHWLLRLPDPQAMASTSLQALIVERLGDTLALIRDEDRARVARLLLEQGLLTDIDES